MKPIRKIKAKYYCKESVKYLFAIGVLTLVGGGPSFAFQFWKSVFKESPQKRKHIDMFRYLRRRGLIQLAKNGHDVHIQLTPEGKKQAGKYQIDELRIERPKQWDGIWRIVIFDIPIKSTLVRNIFRAKLKEFGFYPLQKSTWLLPFPCKEEIEFLREFLGASKKQIQVLEVQNLESEEYLKRVFHL